jgi:8-oxo-dGTP pyrophosphatase MutT (NUDIX family)
MSDEVIDIIDDNNNIISKELKSVVHRKGLKHRVSATLLQRNDGKYLFPTASEAKIEAGKLFHSSAGHVRAGESYKISALRELQEECGIIANEAILIGTFWFNKQYKDRIEKERFEVYKVKYTESMGTIKLNEEQVNEQWLSENELRDIFINSIDYLSEPLKKTCIEIFKFSN